MLSETEVKKAKREAYKELRSLPHYVKNGVMIYSNGSAEQKTADEELVRAVLTSIQNMPITQSSLAILISALHKVGVEAKLDLLIDL